MIFFPFNSWSFSFNTVITSLLSLVLPLPLPSHAAVITLLISIYSWIWHIHSHCYLLLQTQESMWKHLAQDQGTEMCVPYPRLPPAINLPPPRFLVPLSCFYCPSVEARDCSFILSLHCFTTTQTQSHLVCTSSQIQTIHCYCFTRVTAPCIALSSWCTDLFFLHNVPFSPQWFYLQWSLFYLIIMYPVLLLYF